MDNAYDKGYVDGMTVFAWHGKNGLEVGSCGVSLKRAVEERKENYNYSPPIEAPKNELPPYEETKRLWDSMILITKKMEEQEKKYFEAREKFDSSGKRPINEEYCWKIANEEMMKAGIMSNLGDMWMTNIIGRICKEFSTAEVSNEELEILREKAWKYDELSK